MMISIIFLVLGIIFFILLTTRMSLLIRIYELENPGASHRDMKDDGLSVFYFTLGCLTFFPGVVALLDQLQKSLN